LSLKVLPTAHPNISSGNDKSPRRIYLTWIWVFRR